MIKYIIGNIIDIETFLSEPDYANITKNLYSDKSDDLDVYSDDESIGYISDAESERSIDDIQEEEPDNIFSLDDIDIENDADENLTSNPMDF